MTTDRTDGLHLSRRERVREATLEEIKRTARDLVDAHGLSALSLRAIARDMGMTAPGLYRYVAGLDDLLNTLRVDFFAELTTAVDTAVESGPQDLDSRVSTAIRAFRSWGVDNRTEFTLLFGPQVVDWSSPSADDRVVEAGLRFGALFFRLFREVWEDDRFTPPPPESLPSDLLDQILAAVEDVGPDLHDLPPGAVRLLLGAWIRLYGLVCMEVFDPMYSMLGDMSALFEAELRDVCDRLGVRCCLAGANPTQRQTDH